MLRNALSGLFVLLCLVGTRSVFAESRMHEARGMLLDERVVDMPHLKVGPFVRLGDGSIFTVEGTNALVSRDEGQSWQSTPIFSEPERFSISWERAIYRTHEGHIIVAFMNMKERHWTWSDELGDAPGAKLPTWVVMSEDDGRTWNEPQKMHDAWTGAVRDIIETSDGGIVFTAMQMQHNPGRHTALTYRSDDRGRTWTPSNVIDLGGAGHHGGISEPTIEELKDGRLLMFVRTNWMQLWRMESKDGGRTWHNYGPSGIPASSAPAMLKRLQSGRLILAWNHAYPVGATSYPLSGGDRISTATPVSNHRQELSIAFSEDEGRTWSPRVVIARRQRASLAYPYIFEAEPGVLWITTMQGGVRVRLKESDFVGKTSHVTARPIRIACVGDSITFGMLIPQREKNSYPAQLQRMLNDRAVVGNFGHNGTTVLLKGPRPYMKQPEYQQALAFEPDVVVVKLGTNDSVPRVWQYEEEFEKDLTTLVRSFRELPSQPRVYLCTPAPLWLDHEDPRWINLQKIVPRIRALAKSLDVPLIDLNSEEKLIGTMFSDGVHPTAQGATVIAERVYRSLQLPVPNDTN